MKRTVLTLVLALALVFSLTACSQSEEPPVGGVDGGENPAAGTSPAPPEGAEPGVTELGDDRISVQGWLAYVDLEGGFYAIQDGPPSDTPEVEVQNNNVMVIGDAGTYEGELDSLLGVYVIATGERLDGASIRMAGPEMSLDSIEEMVR